MRHLPIGEDDKAAKHTALSPCHIFIVGILASVVHKFHQSTFTARKFGLHIHLLKFVEFNIGSMVARSGIHHSDALGTWARLRISRCSSEQ